MSRGLVLVHEHFAPAGMIGERARHHGLGLVAVDPQAEPLPDPTGYDAVIVMGSTASVTDRADKPWIDEEIATVGKAVEADVPVLGICFGGQVLAAALGGEVRTARRMELGWVDIESDDPERVPAGPWLAWHEDVLSVPPSADEIARNDCGPQAFAYDQHLGVQFHPEIDTAIINEWIARGGEYLEAAGVDPDGLREQTARQEPRARADAHRLFDRFWHRARSR